MISKDEKELAAQLAAALGVNQSWARIMLLTPQHGGRAAKILSVLDGLRIAPTVRNELRERLVAIEQPPRRKHQKGGKMFAEIEGKKVEVCAASKRRNAHALKNQETAGSLVYAGQGLLLQPMAFPYNRFEPGNTYHFWSKKV